MFDSLGDIGNDSNDDDESVVLQSLQQLTSNIKFASDRKRKGKPMSMANISAIAHHTLQRKTTTCNRYFTKRFSFNMSKLFGLTAIDTEENDTLLTCLRTAWADVTDSGGGDCPWNLDGSLFD